MKDRSMIRLGAMFGLAGAVLAVPANLLHPRTSETAATARYALIADSGIWDVIHYAAGAAILLFLASFVAINRYLDDTPGASWARFALVIGIVGVAAGVITTAVDGYAMKTVVDRWAAAGSPTSGPTFEAVKVLDALGSAFFYLFNGTLLGAAPILAGIATIRSGRFVGWVGGIAIFGGLIGVVVDLWGTLAEPTVFLGNVLFTAAALLVTVWAIVVNWTMFQATAEPAQVVEPGAATT